ncbi:response regulator [Alteromonas facilis]|uniref:response regulator n=1 Tax=Alteromonas facilis TaxID=2048004 RepID=UPI000C288477|nr:response regulator [Alteromonas facilis]
MAKHKVLIAEDDSDLLAVLELMLEEDFDLALVDDGEKAIAAIEQNHFHFILVDIHLPKKSGLDICAYVQTLPANDRPSILVLSGDQSDETIKKAYSLGAGDYIGKPFNVVSFHQRLMRLSRDINQIQALQQKDSSVRNLAEMAMTQASAYGSGLELLARLNRANTIDAFMETLVQGLLAQGYHCAVEFRTDTENYNYDADTKECSENEKKVFQLLHNHGRIYNFGKRAIFNENNSSILVKNMPTEGTNSYDAAIDLFAKLVPALGTRFTALMNIQTMNQTRKSLNETIDMVSKAIEAMEIERRENLESIATSISLSFHQLEMTDEQEDYFIQLIEQKLENNQANETFSEVVTLLKRCAENLADDGVVEQEETDSTSEVTDDDIELF